MKKISITKICFLICTTFFFETQFVRASSEVDSNKNSQEISNSDNSNDTNSFDGKVPVHTGKYITGGVLGSIFGFGIGHGIQGRYSEKGYIYTIAESVSFLLITNSVAKCLDSNLKCNGSISSQFALGYAGFIGFHVWEIVNLWAGARPVSDEQTMHLFLIPDKNNSLSLAFNYQF